ncbi:MAG TPA: hypothetical protein VK936_00990 [Longimicrobiales bacterium]|nr:hypothetical protein [Longimicrobiales bacterium]
MTDDIRHDAEAGDVRERLSAIPGVECAVIDTIRREAWLVLRPDGNASTVAQEAAGSASEYAVHLAFRPEQREQQRVRFLGVQRHAESDHHVRFTVTLEWGGTEYTGSASGDRGGAVELRTIAAAALEAVCAVVPDELRIKLAGVKQVRAFDADLIVVSLYRPDTAPHNLVGVVVIGDDMRRAAAVAVLSALNRLLGNFLTHP